MFIRRTHNALIPYTGVQFFKETIKIPYPNRLAGKFSHTLFDPCLLRMAIGDGQIAPPVPYLSPPPEVAEYGRQQVGPAYPFQRGHAVDRSDSSPQTRSFRSSGSNRSCSASELLLAQKTELPRLTTVYYRKARHQCPHDVSGINCFYNFSQKHNLASHPKPTCLYRRMARRSSCRTTRFLGVPG